MKKKILIVDDEVHILDFLKMNLTRNGFDCIFAEDGETAIHIASQGFIDLVLLDLMIPGIDGLEVCRILRANPLTASLPIIIISAKSEENDKVLGLRIGADDYITKPFSLAELFARIAAIFRRSVVSEPPVIKELKIKDLIINLDTFMIYKNHEPIDFTPLEYNIFLTLAKNIGKVIFRDDLINELKVDSRSLDVHMRNIRKKLNDENLNEGYIKTLRGTGFMFNVD